MLFVTIFLLFILSAQCNFIADGVSGTLVNTLNAAQPAECAATGTYSVPIFYQTTATTMTITPPLGSAIVATYVNDVGTLSSTSVPGCTSLTCTFVTTSATVGSGTCNYICATSFSCAFTSTFTASTAAPTGPTPAPTTAAPTLAGNNFIAANAGGTVTNNLIANQNIGCGSTGLNGVAVLFQATANTMSFTLAPNPAVLATYNNNVGIFTMTADGCTSVQCSYYTDSASTGGLVCAYVCTAGSFSCTFTSAFTITSTGAPTPPTLTSAPTTKAPTAPTLSTAAPTNFGNSIYPSVLMSAILLACTALVFAF